MSVYIPGMEMPNIKNTYRHCMIVFDCEGKATIYVGTDSDSFTTEWEKYPLVPVPEHGDLIERDTLSKRIKEETINQAEFYADRWHPVVLAYGDCYGKVQNAPTIIPADKEAT